MTNFTDPLTVTFVGDDEWITERSFSYWTDCNDAAADLPLSVRCKTEFHVPNGFKTDFASIPRIFWPVIGHPAGPYVQAAVLHDYLYTTQTVSRHEADRIFLEAMNVLSVPRWKRNAMWLAVRSFGYFAYKKNKKA